jgi:hypothetical protein
VDHSILGHTNEQALLLPSRPGVGVGMGTCGKGNGAESVYHAFAEGIGRQGRDVKLTAVREVPSFKPQKKIVLRNCGLVEMPLGTPLKTFIYDVGEGGAHGRHGGHG